jgi:hypothetical protein
MASKASESTMRNRLRQIIAEQVARVACTDRRSKHHSAERKAHRFPMAVVTRAKTNNPGYLAAPGYQFTIQIGAFYLASRRLAERCSSGLRARSP